MTRMMGSLVVALALVVVFGATEAEAQRRGSATKSGPRNPRADKTGEFVFRGGVNLDGSRTINLGGRRGTSPSIAVALSPGVGYYISNNASLDFDLDGSLQLSPALAFNSLGATPGARIEVNQFYARAGVPTVFYTKAGAVFQLGALAGVGYLIPMGERTSSIIGLDYTYWLTPAFRRASPYGKIDVKLGVQQSF